MTIDRTPTKRQLNLDDAQRAAITWKHCYIEISGRTYRSESRYCLSPADYPDFQFNLKLQRENRTTNGSRPISALTDAQKKIIRESFRRFESVETTPGK